MHIDPACGMEVNDDEAQARSTCQGNTYHFCSESCRADFGKNAGRYVETPEQQEEAA